MEFNKVCGCLYEACADGDLLQLESISEHLKIEHARSDNNFAFRVACGKGHLKVAKWLVDTFGLTITDVRSSDNDAFRRACYYGHLNILQFLIGRFQLSEDDYSQPVNLNWIRLMKKGCGEGNKFMVSWFVTNFPNNDIPEECEEFVKEVLNENDVMIKPASKHAWIAKIE